MDGAPRFWLSSNGLGNLPKGGKSELLEDAFIHHLVTAAQESLAKHDESWASKTILTQHLVNVKGTDAFSRLSKSAMFSKGLASRSGTSNALKYLSCFGLTCELHPGFEYDFKETTALHHMSGGICRFKGTASAARSLHTYGPPRAPRRMPKSINRRLTV